VSYYDKPLREQTDLELQNFLIHIDRWREATLKEMARRVAKDVRGLPLVRSEGRVRSLSVDVTTS